MPRLPLPPPLMMLPGSFAYLTLTQRWTAVVQRVITENELPETNVTELQHLGQELLEGRVRSLQDDEAPDWTSWENWLQPYLGELWQNVPWFFAEVYFYRRLLEATHYFRVGSGQGVDPFAIQKRQSLETVLGDIQIASAQMNQLYQRGAETGEWQPTDLIALLYGDLWGNGADLSLRPAASVASVQNDLKNSAEPSHVLVDDTPAVVKQLMQNVPRADSNPARVDVIADNAGFELFNDFCLIDFLLTHQLANTVYLYLKAHPTFVSDATIADVKHTLTRLLNDKDTAAYHFATRIETYLSDGKIQLRDEAFWTAPLAFWEMPLSLQQELSQANLVFIKGDANYRRLLGDRHWAFTTSFRAITGYFPATFVAIRTLKSEIVAGLQFQQVEFLNKKDPQWLINGAWGLIQFVEAT